MDLITGRQGLCVEGIKELPTVSLAQLVEQLLSGMACLPTNEDSLGTLPSTCASHN